VPIRFSMCGAAIFGGWLQTLGELKEHSCPSVGNLKRNISHQFLESLVEQRGRCTASFNADATQTPTAANISLP
jgi:hypothetical protein